MERFYLQMHITNKCHNRCRHCYQNNYTGRDLQIRDTYLIIKELSDLCKRIDVQSEIAITGGDPMLSYGFWETLKTARELCDKVGVLGNPELLEENKIEVLKEAKIDYYQLSLDGKRNTHDQIRYPGSYDKTITAIGALVSFGIKVKINMTKMPINSGQEEALGAIVQNLGASSFNVEDYIPRGKDCLGGQDCSLGYAVMAILPDGTLMACRRVPSSVLGKWSIKKGLEHHFVHSAKMKKYRAMHKSQQKGGD